MSSKRIVTLAILTLLLSVVSRLVVIQAEDQHLAAIFRTIASDRPATLGLDQTAQVTVEITNPTTETLIYQVALSAPQFEPSTPATQEVTIPGSSTTRISWSINPLATGHQPLIVSALSDRDRAANAGPFKSWNTSFEETCFIDVGVIPDLSLMRVILISSSSSLASFVISLAL